MTILLLGFLQKQREGKEIIPASRAPLPNQVQSLLLSTSFCIHASDKQIQS